jgi:GNAT superfamily N-acetyltransferase
MDAPRARIRNVRSYDRPAIAAFYAALSPDARRTRFFGACRSITDLQARQFAGARERGAHGWIALDADHRVVGHLCLEPLHLKRDRVEEIAVAVADEWREHGLGHALLDVAIASARHRGIVALEATMLTGNYPIHALLEHSGLPWTCRALEPGTETIRLELRQEAFQGAA